MKICETADRPVVLQFPQHLDGVDQADVCVVEVVEGSQGECGQDPNQGLRDIRNQRVASEQDWANVIHHDGLNA